MIKHKWIKIMGTLVAVTALSAILAVTVFAAVNVDPPFDTKSPGLGIADIVIVTDSSDGTNITVVLDTRTLLGNAPKYRVHFDYKDGLADVADRNNDTFVNAADFCFTTSDDTSKRHRGRDTGPGSWVQTGNNQLTLTVPYAALLENDNSPIDPGDTVFIWVDTQLRGVQDRAPDTDATDGCAKPELIGEVIVHVLN